MFEKSSLLKRLNKYPVLKGDAAVGISMQLSTLSALYPIDSADLNKATANLLIGVVTNAAPSRYGSLFDSREPDVDRINKHGKIHPSLVVAVANYAKDNLAGLATLNDKELQSLGEQLKKACANLNLTPDNSRVPLIAATQKLFNEVELPAVAKARLAAKPTVSVLSDQMSGSTHSTNSIANRLRSAIKSRRIAEIKSQDFGNGRGG